MCCRSDYKAGRLRRPNPAGHIQDAVLAQAQPDLSIIRFENLQHRSGPFLGHGFPGQLGHLHHGVEFDESLECGIASRLLQGDLPAQALVRRSHGNRGVVTLSWYPPRRADA